MYDKNMLLNPKHFLILNSIKNKNLCMQTS